MCLLPAQGRSLFRQLFRLIRQLPTSGGVQAHYRRTLRSEFLAYEDEDDEELLQRLHHQALTDARWVLSKYSNNSAHASP